MVGTSGAPVPEGGEAAWTTASDGLRLRTALFPSAAGRGSVVLSPGRAEPIEKYFEVVEELRARGFAVLAQDWRGQGLSARMLKDRMRGHTHGAAPYLSDFQTVLAAYEDRLPKPWVALGHSMGGGLTALALVEGETRFAAAALSAPMLGVKLPGLAPKTVKALAGFLGKLGLSGAYVPGGADPLKQRFAANVLTHDQARWDRFHDQMVACPDIRLGGATWGWVEFALDLSAEIQKPGAVEAVRTPILALSAGEEALVDNALTRRFAERAAQATLVEIEGARHELFMETDAIRARVWEAFDAFLKGAGV